LKPADIVKRVFAPGEGESKGVRVLKIRDIFE
jgi:hypothetical protein